MESSQQWALIIGFVLPLAISFVQQPTWSEPQRAGAAFAVCVVAGLGTAYFGGQLALTPQTAVQDILIVLVAAISTYKGLWQPTGIAPAIEKATSPKPAA